MKDDTARLRAAAADAAEARMLGEGSFGRVFLGRDADTGADVAIKVEDVSAAAAGSGDSDDSGDNSGSWDSGELATVTPLELEHEVMSKVMHVSGLAGFAR